MYKIGIIGDKDSVLAFQAIGIECFSASNYREANKWIYKLAKEDYAVLFITEALAAEIEETLDAFKDKPFPAIILIPDNSGSIGLGMAGIKKSVEKAIGTDIIFGKEG